MTQNNSISDVPHKEIEPYTVQIQEKLSRQRKGKSSMERGELEKERGERKRWQRTGWRRVENTL